MNYFELFEIPVQFKVDRGLIRKKYFELSKLSHPDYFATSGNEAQQNALDSSALLNQAFKTLNNSDATLQYILKEKGLLEEGEKYNLPPTFLAQMMEINEALEEGEDSDNTKTKLLAQVEELEGEIYEPVKHIIENYSEGVTSTEALLRVKDYYFKKKYLQRLTSQSG
jgi:molecular chaperone HscB